MFRFLTRFGINTANSVAAGVSSTADRTWSIRVTQVDTSNSNTKTKTKTKTELRVTQVGKSKTIYCMEAAL